MSRVYFDSPSRSSELYGSERAHAGVLVNDLAMIVLRPLVRAHGELEPPLLEWLPRDHWLRGLDPRRTERSGSPYATFEESFRAWFGTTYMEGGLLDPQTGERYEPWLVALNTAIAAGSRPIRLLARMHATCEIHGYMEGEDRDFVAEIIEQGRRDEIMRPKLGWEQVVEHLRERDDEPVVLSYTVEPRFPHPALLEEAGTGRFAGDEEYEAWFELDQGERWRQGIEALRKLDETKLLRWSEERFDVQGFGNGASAFDLAARIRRLRAQAQGELTADAVAEEP